MTGRPKPTALRLIDGNPSKRPLPNNEPAPRGKIPSMPRGLDREAANTWRRLAPRLHRLGLLTEIDGDALAILCQIRSRTLEIGKQLNKSSVVLTVPVFNKDGDEIGEREVPNPWAVAEHKYFQVYRAYANEFGTTPRGRTGLVVGTDASKGDDLLD